MSTLDAPISGKTTASLIDAAALKFTPAPRFFKLLERHRAAVLTLRARDASYTQIQDLLKEYHVFVSEPAIARFCRKYRDELQRLRLLLEQETDAAPAPIPAAKPPATISTASITPNSIAPTSRKMRDLRGDF
jgi:DNA-binding MurR/RpiR family transcriptional regulator